MPATVEVDLLGWRPQILEFGQRVTEGYELTPSWLYYAGSKLLKALRRSVTAFMQFNGVSVAKLRVTDPLRA